jgi:hypothetical protein
MLRLIWTLAALGQELQEVFSVPQDLPNSITWALTRLESSTKTGQGAWPVLQSILMHADEVIE